MMEHLQKDNLLPEAYAIIPSTLHTLLLMLITVALSLWLIIRFYKNGRGEQDGKNSKDGVY